MALEAYSPCPCGSGKKFKWCCQPFYSQIERVFIQDENGQHEAAAAAMEQLVQQFPGNAEVWGRRAELLWNQGNLDEAEAALDKALSLNPKYAMGYHLRGMFRHQEREYAGALLLYRKAIELADPDTHDLVAEIQMSIAQCELLRKRPLAARAALDIALRHVPSLAEAQRLEQEYFGKDTPFHAIQRQRFTLLPLPKNAAPDLKQAWQQALASGQSGKLADALKAFEKLAQAHPREAPVLYNLALLRAWLGDHAGAIAALDHYVAHETDPQAAEAAWCLAESLRQAEGMEELADWLVTSVAFQVQDLRGLANLLESDRRFIEFQRLQQAVAGLMLDREFDPAIRPEIALFELPRVAAHVVIVGNTVRFYGVQPELLEKAIAHFQGMMGSQAIQGERTTIASTIQNIAEWLLPIRIPKLPDEDALRLIRACYAERLEQTWPNRRLRSLGHRTPLEAMTCAAMRPRVRGLVGYLKHAAAILPFPYDLAPLRQLLEAVAVDPEARAVPLLELEFPTLAWRPKKSLADCTVEELNSLPLDAMNEADLRQALQAAQRQQHPRLIATFAEALLGNTEDGEERFGWTQALVLALAAEGDLAGAQARLDEALKEDQTRRNGARQMDLEMLRARLLLGAREGKPAYEVLVRLIQKQPSNLDLLGTAAEGMLKVGMRPQAAQFADHGLAHARAKGDKNRVGYFQDLLAAAKRG